MSRDDEGVVTTDAVQTTEAETHPAEVQTVATTEGEVTNEVAPIEASTDPQAVSEAPVEKPEGPTDEEIQSAFADFETAANTAVDGRDSNSGDLTAESVDAVKAAYKALPNAATKTKARNWLEEGMKTALTEGLDAVKARAFMVLGGEVKSAGGHRDSVIKAPVDPTEEHVARITAMYLAISMVPVAEGVADDWSAQVSTKANELGEQVNTYREYLNALDVHNANTDENKGDGPAEPEVDSIVANAAKLARGRQIGRTRKAPSGAKGDSTPRVGSYNGPRRNVRTHIAQVFENVPVGTFLKIGEIANATSTEYGDDHPSSGAVTAAFNSSNFNVAGVEAATNGGIKGARKVA
jgi:hypothetical protein